MLQSKAKQSQKDNILEGGREENLLNKFLLMTGELPR
jgi:hypothetical protein